MPRKKTPHSAHAAEFTVEKSRHQDFIRRYAYPLRDAAPTDLENFWEHRYLFHRALNANWSDLGPANYAGRATCIAVDPANPNIVFAGAAAGGLWKSRNRGAKWEPCWPNGLNQNIGAIAFDPSNSQRLICATGEGNFSSAAYPGSGIFQSLDGGFTWTSLLTAPGGGKLAYNTRQKIPRRVSSISFSAPDGTGARRIAFGTVSNDPSLPGGLFLDGGDTGVAFVTRWGNRPYNCYSVAWHPTEPDVLYVAIEAGGSINGIWRSEDAGASWDHLTTGMPPGELLGRISLAISPSDPSTLYALASSRGRRVIGVFRSADRGDSWQDTAGRAFESEGQLAYNNAIAVHPNDPKVAICGAQNLFRTTDGGVTWQQISTGDPGTDPKKRAPGYVHPDQHAVVMPGGKLVLSANDGGIAISEDLGDTWTTSSQGMATIMFYDGDVSQANGQVYGGGSQDNGTLLAGVAAGVGLREGSKGARDFVRVLAGDGGYIVFDPENVERVFASSQGNDVRLHEPGRRWSRGIQLAPWIDISPDIPKEERGQRSLTVLAIEPGERKRDRKVFLGTYRLWVTESEGALWAPASQFGFDGSSISAIEVSAAQEGLMYVGTSSGGVFRSRDGGVNWSADLSGPEIPQVVVTCIRTHPKDPDIVAVAMAATGMPQAVLHGHDRPFSHIFLSTNGGKTWDDIDGGKLPNVVFTSLEFESHPPYRLFAGGDAGPWLYNPAQGWISLAGNMPNVVISDMAYQHKDRTLMAVTYGRGMWRMRVPRRFTVAAADPSFSPAGQLPPVDGYVIRRHLPVPEPKTPSEGRRFDKLPRETALSWKGSARATGYVAEVVSDSGARFSQSSRQERMTVVMLGPGAWHWRVWGLYPNGECSLPSALRTFTYER